MHNSIEPTDVYFNNLEAYNAGTRLIINQGGTASSKTYSILQLLITIALRSNTRLLISIVSETFPHLKRGAMRDFFNIIDPWYDVSCHNKTDNIYKIGKCDVEFFAADDQSKLRGARRDILFVNEVNNITKPAFDQLEVRTRKTVFIDFNPVARFWAHEEEGEEDVVFIRSTYLDNEFNDPQVIKSIESRRDKDPNWWRVYGLGEVGAIEGIIFSKWTQIDSFPEHIPYWCGLDYGYTNDPSALIKVGVYNDDLYADELFYQPGLKNPDIAKLITDNVTKHTEIFADSAEPKSRDEIYAYGINIHSVKKGADSINNGIDIIHRYNLKVTQRSVNLIKELRNYTWLRDKEGQLLNKPRDLFNHGIDAMRYAAMMKLNIQLEQGWVV